MRQPVYQESTLIIISRPLDVEMPGGLGNTVRLSVSVLAAGLYLAIIPAGGDHLLIGLIQIATLCFSLPLVALLCLPRDFLLCYSL